MRPPSWDGSDEVDIESIDTLVEIPLGIIMVTSFQMKLQFKEEIDMHTIKMSYVYTSGNNLINNTASQF